MNHIFPWFDQMFCSTHQFTYFVKLFSKINYNFCLDQPNIMLPIYNNHIRLLNQQKFCSFTRIVFWLRPCRNWPSAQYWENAELVRPIFGDCARAKYKNVTRGWCWVPNHGPPLESKSHPMADWTWPSWKLTTDRALTYILTVTFGVTTITAPVLGVTIRTGLDLNLYKKNNAEKILLTYYNNILYNKKKKWNLYRIDLWDCSRWDSNRGPSSFLPIYLTS